MTVRCAHGDEPVVIPVGEHAGPLDLALDVNLGDPLWCPAWPEQPAWERRSRAILRPRPKRFRVVRPKGQWTPGPGEWHYSFVGA